MVEQTEEMEQATPESIAVRVIEVKGKSALVQTDDLRRWFVPANKVEGGQVAQDVMDKAIAHGIAWEQYLQPVQPERIAQLLRRRGIYTVEDLTGRDRELIRIGTKLITEAVRVAAKQAAKGTPKRK